MKRAVNGRARVGHHLDLADLERGNGRVMRPRFLPRPKVANNRGRQPFIRDQAIFNRVTEVNHFCFHVV